MAFCEGDDYWMAPWKLEQQVAKLDRHTEVGAVHTSFDRLAYVRGAWRTYRDQKLGTVRDGSLFEVMLSRNVMQTCTAMIRGELIRDYLRLPLPFDTYAVGDWPLFLFVSGHSRIAFIDSVTAAYRRTPGSEINRGLEAEMTRARSYLRMHRDFCDAFHVDEGVRRSSELELELHLARVATRVGDVETAKTLWSEIDRAQAVHGRDRLYRSAAGNRWLRRLYDLSSVFKGRLADFSHYREKVLS